MSKSQKLDFNFSEEETLPCRIAIGWDNGGKTGQYFGNIIVGDVCWAIVLWDNEEDPDMHKIAGIEINQSHWIEAKNLD